MLAEYWAFSFGVFFPVHVLLYGSQYAHRADLRVGQCVLLTMLKIVQLLI